MSQTITCQSFAFQEDAQAAFDADRSGLRRLDADGDGVPCETLPRRGSVTPAPGDPSSTSATTSTSSTTTVASSTTTSSTTTSSATSAGVAGVLARIAALECNGNFQRDLGRTYDEEFALPFGTSQADYGRISDARRARVEALDYCFGGRTPNSDVTPTDDDGSTATVSGDQVTDVPVGSAETGGA